jgi:prophage DNA circulation protein
VSWRDQLGKVRIGGRDLVGASYRGVPFFVASSERAGGRRTVTKEFPLRDRPFIEDLGRAARGFPVEGYVLGDDYLAARDALISALEDTAGPGQLLHPYHGALQVICTSFRVRETPGEGGKGTFAIDFAETDAQPRNPTASPDLQAVLAASADAAVAASGADFQALYDVENSPAWALESLAAVLASAASTMDELLSPLLTSAQEVSALKSQLDGLELDAAALVRRPAELVEGLAAALVSLTQPVLLPRLLDVYATPPPPKPDPATSTRVKEGVNYDLVLALIRRGLAIQAARLLPLQEFDSYEAAVALRDQVAAMLDDQLEVAGDDAYPALQQLRADLVRAVPGEDSSLARLVHYTPPVSTPSIALAWQLYGSLDMELDLVSRNHVQNPCFVLGGRELEVLSGG